MNDTIHKYEQGDWIQTYFCQVCPGDLLAINHDYNKLWRVIATSTQHGEYHVVGCPETDLEDMAHYCESQNRCENLIL